MSKEEKALTRAEVVDIVVERMKSVSARTSMHPSPRQVFEHQADSILSQATPVQNTWYPILATTLNCELLQVGARVADTTETLEIRVIMKNETVTIAWAGTNDQEYNIFRKGGITAGLAAVNATDNPSSYFLYEDPTIAVDIRKTTAAGTGTFTAVAKFATKP